MQNVEYAKILSETADLMEIAAEDGFRIRSYRNASNALENHPESIEVILADPKRSVTEIPGIGKGIAAVLAEIRHRGSFDRRDELLAKYPPTALEMLKIQGLGPKSIALIIERFRVTTIDDLERLCQEQKLREVPRMGAKLEEKILRSIGSYRQSSGRFLLNFATSIVETLLPYLSTDAVEQVTPAGSFRRGRETVGDLDFIAATSNPADVLDSFVKHPRVTEVLGHGDTKASVKFGVEGIQVDLRAVPAESYGAALMYFTGSKTHNVAIRQRALRMGYTLNEYALTRLDGETPPHSASSEEEIYAALGLHWIPPELRENAGEIEAAEKGPLPALVTLDDMKGDVHMHTRESDGRASLGEMAEAAAARGYAYIAITDHSKSLAMANGLDEERAIRFADKVREMDQSALPLRVLSGLECDIKRDGAMDLDDSALSQLDVVIASIHSYMNLESAEMTDRLLRAIENPYVSILGHPTGRMLLHREPFPYDFDAIATAAAKHGVAMEINASPERLDLHATLIRIAKSKGCKFVISTDAHHPKHLLNMRYGVTMARRGGLEPADVLNALPIDRFRSALRPR